MPEYNSVAAEYARAVAKPTRLRLVAALADGPRSLASLARQLRISESVVVRHARALQAMGLVQTRIAEGQPRVYELLREPVFEDAEWEGIPLPVRRSAVGAVVTQMHATAAAAVDAGGFDRADMRLGRVGARVTEAQWREMSAIVADAAQRLMRLSEDAARDEEQGDRVAANAILMLFTGEHLEAEDQPSASSAFAEGEARDRFTSIVEALEDLMVQPTAIDWARVEAFGNELRLIARAAASPASVRSTS